MDMILELLQITPTERVTYKDIRMFDIRHDFFSAYPEPIIENGIRALDMVLFERFL